MLQCTHYWRLSFPFLVAVALQLLLMVRLTAGSLTARKHDAGKSEACLVQTSRQQGDEKAEEDVVVGKILQPQLKVIRRPSVPNIGRNNSRNNSITSNNSSVKIVMGWFSKQFATESLQRAFRGWHVNSISKKGPAKITAALLTVSFNSSTTVLCVFLTILGFVVLCICLPLSRRFLPHSQTPADSNSQRLATCPELFVPKDKECWLRLPRIREANSRAPIRNSQGTVMLCADLSSSIESGSMRMSLMSPDERRCFAFCKQPEPGVLCIFSTQESKPIAEVRHDIRGGGFLLDTSCGKRLLLSYQMQTGSTEVTDDGKLLAFALPESKRHSGELEICVGPGVDAGLMLLAMLGTDAFLLEANSGCSSRIVSRMPSRQTA